jgi:hypothetical protein
LGYLASLQDFVQHTLETAPFWRGSRPSFSNFFGFFSKEPGNILSLAGFKGASERPMLFERQKRIFYL